jgi:hypothetical protein
MWILGRKKALKDVRDRLQQAITGIPIRARGFHQAVMDCSNDIDQALTATLPEATQVEDLSAQAEELIRLAPELGKMLEAILRLETQIDRLLRQVQENDDEVSAAVSARCSAWMAELSTVGFRVNTRRGLNQAMSQGGNDTLSRIRVAVEQHVSVLSRLVDAERLLERFNKPSQTARLEAAIANLREHLARTGPNQPLLDEMEKQFDAVRKEADAPPPPPPQVSEGVRSLRGLIPTARQWLQIRKTDAPEMRDLQDRMLLVENNSEMWNSPEVEKLRIEASALVNRLREMAVNEALQSNRLLSRWVTYYREACASDDGMMEALAELNRHISIERPGDYEQWRELWEEASNKFYGLAQAKIAKLEEHCQSRIQALLARAQEIEQGYLRREVFEAVGQAKREVQRIQSHSGREATLEALRISSEVEEQLEQLGEQAAADRSTYESEKSQAMKKRQDLLAAADVASIPVDVAEYSESPGTYLDGCFLSLRGFVAGLESAQKAFLRQCDDVVDVQARFSLAAAEVLRNVPGLKFETYTPPAPNPDPRARAEECARAGKIREQLAKNLTEAAEKLVLRLDQHRKRLEEVASLDGETGRQAHDFLETISLGLHDDPDPVERGRALVKLVKQCDNFLWDIDRDRREAQERRILIKRAWLRFFEDGLRRYFPRYGDRVFGLLQGAPEQSCDWAAVNTQLIEAERLLNLLDHSARRVAASELNEACRILAARVQHVPTEERNEIRRLLEEVQTYRDRLPPPEMRRQIVESAARR